MISANYPTVAAKSAAPTTEAPEMKFGCWDCDIGPEPISYLMDGLITFGLVYFPILILIVWLLRKAFVNMRSAWRKLDRDETEVGERGTE
ncbi:MAG: hypothetical protein AAGK01_12410 [Pseudomonadota bacterium]